MNHRFTDRTFAARPLWFETHLKGSFVFPETPEAELVLRTEDGVPRLRVRAAESASQPITDVAVDYGYDRDPRNRFWRSAEAMGASKRR